MAYFDYAKGERISREPEIWPDNDGWLKIDCGCNNGLVWDKTPAEECHRCEGRGYMAMHIKTFAVNRCPGGGIWGRLRAKDAQAILTRFIELSEEKEDEHT